MKNESKVIYNWESIGLMGVIYQQDLGDDENGKMSKKSGNGSNRCHFDCACGIRILYVSLYFWKQYGTPGPKRTRERTG